MNTFEKEIFLKFLFNVIINTIYIKTKQKPNIKLIFILFKISYLIYFFFNFKINKKSFVFSL